MSTWTTNSGKTMNIVEMETSHILNCIAMLKRKIKDYPGSSYYLGLSDMGDDLARRTDEVNEDIANKIMEQIGIFEREIELREMGKPKDEVFPADVIQSWEVPLTIDQLS